MTSFERHEARYQRRKAKRLANRQKRSDALGSISDIFSFHNMYYYGKKCCNGVRWKQSTQNFERHLISNTAKTRSAILNGKWKQHKCIRFKITERGKTRVIDAPHITDRQVHKVLCNEALFPLYNPSMIYDNGASQKGKGLHWHYKRLIQHLVWANRHYGRDKAVAVLLDLKGFFPNAPRDLIYQRHSELVLNDEVRRIADKITEGTPCNSPGRGLPLGVEASQLEMVAMPSCVDNWIKCQCGIKCAGHYMDDYYAILPDKESAKVFLDKAIKKFEEYDIMVSVQKCKLVPLSKPIKWCKGKFTVQKSGHVTVNVCRDGMKRARRKFKFFQRTIAEGTRTEADLDCYMQCQLAYYSKYNDYGRVQKLLALYMHMFGHGPRKVCA